MNNLITLDNLQKAKNEITAVKDIKDILQIVDQAKALEAAAKAMRKSIEVQNEIAELTLRAKRKEGELIKQMKVAGEIKDGQPEKELSSSRTVLSDMNISRNESSETQKIANIQEAEFETYIKETVENKTELTTAGLIRSNKENFMNSLKVKKDDYRGVVLKEFPDKKYEIIYCDPPWNYSNDMAFYGQDVEKHYVTMTEKELLDLPVRNIAENNCVLYMWATAPKLDIAINVLKGWGFDYKTCLIWNKVKHNMGFYASIRHELLLIGGIGSTAPTDKSYANQTNSIYTEVRGVHSKKPVYYYEMIEKMHLTKRNKIELFSRNKQIGWDSWGLEA